MSWIYNVKRYGKNFWHELTDQEYQNCLWYCDIVRETQLEKGNIMRGPTTYTRVTGRIIRETDKAVRFSVDDPSSVLHDYAFWFPISQCKQIVRAHPESEDLDMIEVADWLIEAKADEIAGGSR
jgi:hypothetical protein